MFFTKARLRAAGIHLTLSLLVALAAALLVFGLWYPYPYRDISGGRELFKILVAVDVVLGPLITLAIFDMAKGWPVLRRDLAVVALIQVAALGYGLWSVFAARPVHLVFEYNRFRVVHAVDVLMQDLDKAPPELRALPLLGPTTLSLRPFKDGAEKIDATMAAMQGAQLSGRPQLWQSYAAGKTDVLREARPISVLKAKFSHRMTEIDRVIAQTGRTPDKLVFVPMVGRKTFWTVLLDPASAEILGFVPIDSF